jgi:predicted Zn-dependent protease
MKMNPLIPRRSHLSAIVFAVALTLIPLASAGAQQQRDSRSETPAVGSPIGAIFDLGSSIVNSATGMVSADPYAQFRGTRYTNSGLISERDEVRLGNQLHQEVGKRFSLTNEGQERASRIGLRVARTSLRPGLAYRFHVVRDKEINAFSIPGGHIYVTTALMDMANDDELASVLSHEIGHVVARHSLKTIQQSQALGSLVGLFGSITGIAGDTAGELGTAAAQIVASGLLAVHNREEEREADFLGVRAMPRAGFDPEGMVTMFQKLQRVGNRDSSLLGSLFNDHPDVQERIDNTRFEISRMRPARGRR